MEQSVRQFEAALGSLVPTLNGLKKYEANFSTDAKAVLAKAIQQAEKASADVGNAATGAGEGIAAYLMAGARGSSMKAAATAVQQSLNGVLAGSMPLPRSSKEELGNMKTVLAGLKFEVADDQSKLAVALQNLYNAAVNKAMDVDTVEVQVDDVMRKVMQNLYSATQLGEHELQTELHSLEEAVNQSCGGGDGAMLSLALNSLQRLHANQIKMEESEDEEEEEQGADAMDEDDEDDPFFMPVPTTVVKMADEKKFAMLAEPLDKADAAKPMLQLDEEPRTPSKARDPSSSFPPATPGLTAADFEPVPAQELAQAASNAAGRAAAAGSVGAATEAMQGLAVGAGAPAREASLEGTQGSPGPASGPASPGVRPPAVDTVQSPGEPTEREPVSPSTIAQANGAEAPPQNEDKHKQFVNFLQGENPGACMFHAQMRLSLEGCRKLSNFLSSSARVRALSLSHNYLGDDGMKIICEGLVQNTSVTAIDLPDNNISDIGCMALAEAIKHNPSLTQVQLAFNQIGDAGAVALAQMIKTTQSLKKLGLSHNQIGKAGCQALTAAINSNQSLKHLQLLPGNPVEEKDAKALAKALKRNKKFSIRSLLGMDGA